MIKILLGANLKTQALGLQLLFNPCQIIWYMQCPSNSVYVCLYFNFFDILLILNIGSAYDTVAERNLKLNCIF